MQNGAAHWAAVHVVQRAEQAAAAEAVPCTNRVVIFWSAVGCFCPPDCVQEGRTAGGRHGL
eukprot:COSAG04_NODE_23196_length_342_cov_0.839506_1_plen_60_part_01